MSLVPRGRRRSATILARRGRVGGLVLDHLVALGLEERILDVLGEEPGIVAAPGADHDPSAALGKSAFRTQRQPGRAGREAEGLSAPRAG